jgi:hypothetical protein
MNAKSVSDMRFLASVVATLTIACFALAANDAQAQFGGGGGGGMRRGSGDRAGRSAESASPPRPRAALAERLDEVAAQLLLSPAQGRSWDAFRRAFIALQSPAGGAVALSDYTTAQQAMQQKLSQAQDYFALVESLSDAQKQLDRELDPQQRAAEDKLLPPLLAEFVRIGNAR